ncbi:MAG: hypothetical protein ACK415_10660 [Thermodesulfovibrionales bacterium]
MTGFTELFQKIDFGREDGKMFDEYKGYKEKTSMLMSVPMGMMMGMDDSQARLKCVRSGSKRP